VIRGVVALALIVAAVAGGAFFADHPGQVEIVWQGWRIDTSVGVLAAAAGLFALFVATLALILAGLRRAPRNLRRHRALRRRRNGEAAMTRGLIALAAGNSAEAHRHASRAAEILTDQPIAQLLVAEAAQRRGDRTATRQAYEALLTLPDSEFLGLRGLFAEAMRDGDDRTALPLAERARALRPGARWLAESLVALQARAGAWAAAREALVQAARRGALPTGEARHQRGVVVYELSRAAEREGDLRRAAGLAARAQTLAPDLAEPAAHHARLLLRLGRRRAAARAIERAWRHAPHPDLADAYAGIEADAGAVARAAALHRLAAHNPAAVESRLALAEATLDARLWGEARRHLEHLLGEAAAHLPSRRLCLAMARLEEQAAGDLTAMRQWLDRAVGAPPGPAHTCRRCAATVERWQSLCPRCGGFDTLAWRRVDGDASPGAVPQTLTAPLMLAPPDATVAENPARQSLAPAAQSDN
jgi:HemY protein